MLAAVAMAVLLSLLLLVAFAAFGDKLAAELTPAAAATGLREAVPAFVATNDPEDDKEAVVTSRAASGTEA